MKKRYIYLISLLFFVLAAGFIVAKYQKNEQQKSAAFYPLLDREGVSFQSEEWKGVLKQFDESIKIARNKS